MSIPKTHLSDGVKAKEERQRGQESMSHQSKIKFTKLDEYFVNYNDTGSENMQICFAHP